MEIAVFGGSFDPPTYAHEGIIEACLEDERFDQVWVMPSGVRSDKQHMSGDSWRLEMLKALKRDEFDNDPRLIVTGFELRLPRPTQTYMTYLTLRQTFPEARFWFVYGADSYATMTSWENGTELKRELPMIIVPRAGYDLPPESEHVRHVADLSVMHAGLSSTAVRERLRQGLPVHDFVPRSVLRYITGQQLYGVSRATR